MSKTIPPTALASRLPEYTRLREAMETGKSPVAVSGLAAVHRAFFAAALYRETDRPLVVVCAGESEAKRMAADLTFLTGREELPLLPARELCFHPGTASREWENQRLEVLAALHRGECPVLIATVEGLMQRTLPPAVFAQHTLSLTVGDTLSLEQLENALVQSGYTRCDQVEGIGQFAVRGGILDVFTPGLDLPLRAEFWGDEIDSMGLFDPVTQRRTAQRETVTLLPAGEVIGGESDPPDLSLGSLYKELATAADYLPRNAVVVLCDTPRLSEQAKGYLWQLEESIKALAEEGISLGKHPVFARSLEELCVALAPRSVLYFDSFTTGSLPVRPALLLSLSLRQLGGYGVSFDALVEDLQHYRQEKYAVLLLTPNRRKADALQTMLRERGFYSTLDELLHDLPQPGSLTISVGDLSAGFDCPGGPFAILAEGSAGSARPVRKKRRTKDPNRQRLESFSDLSPGDLVVHENHGIGRFSGLVSMSVEGMRRDYIKIQYAGSDVLYVPALQLDLVSKYIGGGEDSGHQTLAKLGGAQWERTKARAKKAARDMAKGLIQLYAQRQRQPGYAFSPDTPWQQEFEGNFPYPETEDQLRCIEEIKADMERPTPMDRLLCGDVGYGKTEVAFRAVMKCILEGKQAAILVPTTVLAQQHYLTAHSRFSGFPVEIAMLSRFCTPAQTRDILTRTAEGGVDLLIGTHKLLGKEIHFKDLGLLVVDEEQRFGVSHKEKLKKMAKQVDVLTLSATPIPRTLNMALSGLRDMSTLEQPPTNRQPVQTYVMEHDWGVLAAAMRRELDRGGQVYYLHNRTETIARTAVKLQQLLGEEARIAVAHGRMPQEELSDIMSRMTDGEIDILVCTTIIETGIDLPNANTLIIEDADRLGLAQLHQLRGRVGRSTRRASAYMTYRRDKVLTEEQSKRLSAIREYAAFGSGFKIAMRDLEIRGAGNLLGAEQSGFLMSVGYDMYLRLLEEAVLEEQGKPVARPAGCAADLAIPASIPEGYIPSAEQRMDFYRRIARVRSKEEGEDIADELIDRYGDPPATVMNLISVALLRAKAAGLGITEIAQKGAVLRFTIPEPDIQKIVLLSNEEKYRGRLLLSAGEKKPFLSLKIKKGDDVLRLAEIVVRDLGETP